MKYIENDPSLERFHLALKRKEMMFTHPDKSFPVEWVEDLQLLYEAQKGMDSNGKAQKRIASSNDSSMTCDAESRTLLYRDTDVDPSREAIRYLELTLVQGFSDVLYPRWGDSAIDAWEIAKALSANSEIFFDDSQWPLRGAYTSALKRKCLTIAHLP
ncbi:MAG: hypothetical protein GXY15_05395, partial [Candidatus Hydrogenedentes bacterium]|nr:hypothetical protein [Candidatus Hydrogenedentota bacterium]